MFFKTYSEKLWAIRAKNSILTSPPSVSRSSRCGRQSAVPFSRKRKDYQTLVERFAYPMAARAWFTSGWQPQ